MEISDALHIPLRFILALSVHIPTVGHLVFPITQLSICLQVTFAHF